METLTVNLAGKFRKEILNDREHIVAPVTMIVPGVLNGSMGPLYYPPEEVSKDVEIWNHMPIVVYHPTQGGKNVSARTADVLNTQGVGIVLNSSYDDKLRAEAWFDVDKTRRVDMRVLNSLEKNEQMELSTGVSLDIIPEEAGENVHNGVETHGSVRNFRPDHLAILPDQKGACSIADGCGVFNEEQASSIKELVINTINTLNPFKKKGTDMPLSAEAKETIVSDLISNCSCWVEDDKEVLNGFSDEKLQTFHKSLKTSMENEEIANAVKDSEIEVEGAGKLVWNTEKKSHELVKPEEKPEEKKGDEVTTNTKQPQTREEWLNSVPTEIRNGFEYGQQAMQRDKNVLIDQLVKNVGDEDKTRYHETFNSKTIDELQMLVACLPKEQASQPQVNYFGASTPVSNTEPKVDPQDFLPIPDMDLSAN